MVPQPSLDLIFQAVWKADIYPKIQHFLWRALSDCLSVGENLRYRHLARDGSCPRCQASRETVNHILFKCPYARLIWAVSPIPAPPDIEWSDSVYTNFYRVLTWSLNASEESNFLMLGPWILWRLWKSRNAFFFEGEDYDPMSLIRKAHEDFEEWKNRDDMEEKEVSTVPVISEEECWMPPPQNWLKCNSDGAWERSNDHCGVGWILRNHLGDVVWIGGRRLPRGKAPIEAEAESLRWSLSTMVRFNYSRLIFETDCKELVQALQEDESRPCISSFVQDIHYLLAKLGDAQVVFRGRKSNAVADKIAKDALSYEDNAHVLFSVLPSWIKSLVEVEKLVM